MKTWFEPKLEKQFRKYVFCYDMEDENIARKYYHSLRVKDFAKQIAKDEKLTRHERKVVIVAALLHDYMRFEQWKIYKTYRDLESRDHGDWAEEMLFKNHEIEKFYKNKTDFEKIRLAIKYHNKKEVPAEITSEELTICNIIRDADKLDIFNLSIKNKNLFLEDDKKISKKVRDDFYSNKIGDIKNARSESDRIILKLSMIYDINFRFSKKYIIENDIMEKLFENIVNKEKFMEYFGYIGEYVKNSMVF